MSEYQWESSDAYHAEHRLIEYPSGRIVGSVTGSVYQDAAGWYAVVLHPESSEPLGRFVTPDLAKKAVLSATTEKGEEAYE